MAGNLRPALPELSGRSPVTTPVLRPIPAWKRTMLALAAVLVTAAVVIVVLAAVALQAAAGTPRANAVLGAVRAGLAAGGRAEPISLEWHHLQ